MKSSPLMIADKLCSLLNLLKQSNEEFEHVAEDIKDVRMKQSILSIAQENAQYANELSCQLKSLGVEDMKTPDLYNCDELIKNIHSFSVIKDDDEKVSAWKKSEYLFSKAYRDILNEYFPSPALKQMLTYQFNGIKCAFMKIKLLNSVVAQ